MIRFTIARYYMPSGWCIQKPYEKGDAKSYAHSYINNASLQFMDENRKSLKKKYPDFTTFNEQFTIPQKVLDKILADAEKKDKLTARNDEELQHTLRNMRLFLKGLIACDLWDLSEYFQIINEEDPVVMKAVEVLGF